MRLTSGLLAASVSLDPRREKFNSSLDSVVITCSGVETSGATDRVLQFVIGGKDSHAASDVSMNRCKRDEWTTNKTRSSLTVFLSLDGFRYSHFAVHERGTPWMNAAARKSSSWVPVGRRLRQYDRRRCHHRRAATATARAKIGNYI